MEEIVNNIKASIADIRNNEFENEGFKYIEQEIVKKDINVDNIDFKNYQSTIKKQALIDKSKPSNINRKEIETTNTENINIVDDEIFCDDDGSSNEKFDFNTLSSEEKLRMIMNFLKKKLIKLDEENMTKLNELVNNAEFPLKKYITISKIYQEITKITFIKKIDETTYIIMVDELNKKKGKAVNFFK